MSMTLYEISGRYAELAAREANDETLTEIESQEMRQELDAMLKTKSIGIIGYYRNLEAMADIADAEIKRIQGIKKNIEAAQERHKQRIKAAMEYGGIVEVQTGIGKLKIAKNPVSVEVLSMDELPEEFKRYKPIPPPEADKKAIIQHFKDTGELIQGVEIITEKTRLDIK